METLKSMGFSQSTDNNKCIEKMEVVEGSGKESCSTAKGSTKDVEVDDVRRLLLMVVKIAGRHLEMELSHCRSVANLYMSAKCIRELLMSFHWLDVYSASLVHVYSSCMY
ncbi:uncharacterized protein LOC131642898 [Vicia villosa]|uniref:uncharacterized protein LOC131642898 n=1 Tax=Vicia villosa TaxID=3911 RepID=UPI00273B7044|nr:uncharacterized protein LOC131642898 [Vicia villosa]